MTFSAYCDYYYECDAAWDDAKMVFLRGDDTD